MRKFTELSWSLSAWSAFARLGSWLAEKLLHWLLSVAVIIASSCARLVACSLSLLRNSISINSKNALLRGICKFDVVFPVNGVDDGTSYVQLLSVVSQELSRPRH